MMNTFLRGVRGFITCAVIVGAVNTGLLAEESPPPAAQKSAGPSLYEGAVAADFNEVTASQLLLTNPTTMTNVPLKEIIAKIEELTQLQVWIDEQSLTDAGLELPLDSIIPEWPAGEPIRRLLDRLPGNEQRLMTWVVDHQMMTLMTQEKPS